MAAVGSPFENACILTGVGVIAILINSAVITRWGRRRVFLVTGMIICGLAQLIVAVVYDKQGPGQNTGKVRDQCYSLFFFTKRSDIFSLTTNYVRSLLVFPSYT